MGDWWVAGNLQVGFEQVASLLVVCCSHAGLCVAVLWQA